MRAYAVPVGPVAGLAITAIDTARGPAGERIAVGVASFPKGWRHPAEGLQAHPAAEVSFILSGRFELYTEAGTRVVAAGEVLCFDPGEAQGCRALEDSRVLFTVVGEELPASLGETG